MKEKKVGLLALVVLVVLLAGAFAVYRLLGPEGVEGSKTITVHVDHLAGEDRTFTIQTEEEFLRQALEQEELIAGTESAYGLWVETVDGERADEAKEEWWGYNVNGQQAQYGVDSQPVKDGDVYDFTLNVGY